MLELEQVSRSFGDVIAADRISFDVPAGQVTGFVGGNGAGKSTTMRMIMGVLATQGGDIRWNGRPITTMDRRSFGYMPEERGLYPSQRVIDQLVYLAQLKGMPTAEARGAARGLLDRFGLGERARDKVEKLSLGNQQRVQIIASVLAAPAALILDEPFSGLDPDAVDSMVGLLREYTSQGVPVLFSSHQLDLVDRISDRLVILAAGRVVASGTADELRDVDAAPLRYRLVLTGDAGWVRDLRGIRAADLEGNTGVVEVVDETASRHLLEEAVRRGGVLEFSPVRPTLGEIYREVTRSDQRAQETSHMTGAMA